MNEERRLALRGPYHVSRHVTDTVNGQLSEVQSNKSHISNPKLAKASKRVLLKPAQRGEGRVGALGHRLGMQVDNKSEESSCESGSFEAPVRSRSYRQPEYPRELLSIASSAADRISARETVAKRNQRRAVNRRIFSRAKA